MDCFAKMLERIRFGGYNMDMLNTALTEITDEQKKTATITFAIHGSYKVLQDWINTPNRISPEEETKLILGLAGKVCGWSEN